MKRKIYTKIWIAHNHTLACVQMSINNYQNVKTKPINHVVYFVCSIVAISMQVMWPTSYQTIYSYFNWNRFDDQWLWIITREINSKTVNDEWGMAYLWLLFLCVYFPKIQMDNLECRFYHNHTQPLVDNNRLKPMYHFWIIKFYRTLEIGLIWIYCLYIYRCTCRCFFLNIFVSNNFKNK